MPPNAVERSLFHRGGGDGECKGDSQGSRPPGLQSGILKSYGGILAAVTKGQKANRHGMGRCARGQS